MNPIAAAAQDYLQEVLGAPPSPARAWSAKGLPYFVSDGLHLVQVTLFGHQAVLAIDETPGALAPAEIATRLRHIRTHAELALYAASALSYDDRRRLIEHKVPFIIPGNQLYLPDLGIDLREHFRRRAEDASTSKMSPSTQALLLRHLLDLMQAHKGSDGWHVAKSTRTLGYTVMTGSRAANEIVTLGLGEIERRGRSIFINFKATSGPDIWIAAKPFLRTPVARTRWLPELPKDLVPRARRAGMTALALHSLLQEPEHATFAVRREDWLAVAERAELSRPEPGAVELQVWNYSPALMDRTKEIDPLSMIVSLRDDPDERVQAALNDLERELPW